MVSIGSVFLSLGALASTILSFAFTLAARDSDGNKNGKFVVLAIIFGTIAILLLVIKLGTMSTGF